MAEAKTQLNKAKSVLNNAAEVSTNQALMALVEGNTQNAETYLAQGSGADTYNQTLGLLNIAKGNYGQAAKQLAGSNTNAQALAELLNNDLASAAQTLNSVKNADATTSYLKAILAARQNNAASVTSNLKDAIQKDNTLAKRALNDLEFQQFATTVAGLVK